MAVEILIPKLGLTMTEGVIEEWVALPGALVRVGDILMRLGTDKVDVDVEAEEEGIFHPGAPAGATLPPGAVAGWLLAAGEDPPAAAPAPVAAGSDAPATTTAAPAAVGTVAAPAAGGRLLASPNARRVARELGVEVSAVVGTGPGGRIVSEDVEAAPRGAAPAVQPVSAAGPEVVTYASPLLRKLAKEQGLDLATVAASGPGGRIRRDDVQGAVARLAATETTATETTATEPAAARGPQPGDVIPLTGIRGAIARNMHASLQTMAQLTLGREVDVSALVAVRAQLKADYTDLGLRAPTITDFVVKAVALALRQHPLLNATVRDDAVVLEHRVNVGLAVSVDAGLVVPVLVDADQRGVADLAEESAALAATARAGRLALTQLEGATFAVTSLGTSGIDFFTPVISPGNVGILGVGRIKDGVRWDGEVPRRTDVLTLSLTFDHRAVDGAPAADFLAAVAALLGRPLVLLAG